MLTADDEEEDGADGEEEKDKGEDDDGDEVGVEGRVVHGGGDDGGDGEGGLEEGEIAQRGLPVLQTTLDLGSKIVRDILLGRVHHHPLDHLSENIPTDRCVRDHWVEMTEQGSHLEECHWLGQRGSFREGRARKTMYFVE